MSHGGRSSSASNTRRREPGGAEGGQGGSHHYSGMILTSITKDYHDSMTFTPINIAITALPLEIDICYHHYLSLQYHYL